MTDKPLTTESRNPVSRRLDELPVEGVLSLMNEEDRGVPEAVCRILPQISAAVELLVEVWLDGGRWIYVGSGTSGRIAAMDAAECPPTFGVPAGRVVAVMAGGGGAAEKAVEGAEDDRSAAVADLEALSLSPADAVVGLAASGRTPYTVAAVRHAAEKGCVTVGISNNAGTELSRAARVGIEAVTGPEVLTGSTRLKAGTAQKLVLNMLSTAAFVRLHKVYENLMVDLQASNEKLKMRARRIVGEATNVPEAEAERLLRDAGGSVKTAIVMGKATIAAEEARCLLEESGGDLRRTLDDCCEESGPTSLYTPCDLPSSCPMCVARRCIVRTLLDGPTGVSAEVPTPSPKTR